MDATYNDIVNWKYNDVVTGFVPEGKKIKTYQVRTQKEADDLFNDETFAAAEELQVR